MWGVNVSVILTVISAVRTFQRMILEEGMAVGGNGMVTFHAVPGPGAVTEGYIDPG